MSELLLFFVASFCPTPEVINDTKTWEKIDELNYQQAVKRCAQLYSESPCLKSFRKKADRTYWAICGAPKTEPEIHEEEFFDY
jgi:hypothetical protein